MNETRGAWARCKVSPQAGQVWLCPYQITTEGHGLPSLHLLGERKPLSRLEAFPVRAAS